MDEMIQAPMAIAPNNKSSLPIVLFGLLLVVVVVVVTVVLISSKTSANEKQWAPLTPSTPSPSAPPAGGKAGCCTYFDANGIATSWEPMPDDTNCPPAHMGSFNNADTTCATGCCTSLDDKTLPLVTTADGCRLSKPGNGWFDTSDKTCKPLGCCCIEGNSTANVTEDYCKYQAAQANPGSPIYTFDSTDAVCAKAGETCQRGCCCTNGKTATTTKQACKSNNWVNDCVDDTCCNTADTFCTLGCCCVDNALVPNQSQQQCSAQNGTWTQDPTCASSSGACLLGCCCTDGVGKPSTQEACPSTSSFTPGDTTCSDVASDCTQGCCCMPPKGPGAPWETQPNTTQAWCTQNNGTFTKGDVNCMSTDLTCIKGCCCDNATGKATPNVTSAQCKTGTWLERDTTCATAKTSCTLGCCCVNGAGRQTSKDTCSGDGGKWTSGVCDQTKCPTPQTWACTGATATKAGKCVLQTDGNGEYTSAIACANGCASATNKSVLNYYVVNNTVTTTDSVSLAPLNDPQNPVFSNIPTQPQGFQLQPGNKSWYEGATICAYASAASNGMYTASSSSPLGQCAVLPDITSFNTIGTDQAGNVVTSN
jgi:hypothetical protein